MEPRPSEGHFGFQLGVALPRRLASGRNLHPDTPFDPPLDRRECVPRVYFGEALVVSVLKHKEIEVVLAGRNIPTQQRHVFRSSSDGPGVVGVTHAPEVFAVQGNVRVKG